MIELLREVHLPFLAVLLLIAGAAKAFPAGTDKDRGGPMVAWHQGRAFVVLVAFTEVTLGVLLLTTRLLEVRLATVVFFATTASVVADLVRRRSEKACGCFGRLSTTPASRLGVLRAIMLTAAAVASVGVPTTGVQVLETADARSIALLAADCVVFAALSPEIVAAVDRLRHPIPCELRAISLAATFATLRSSTVWREYAALLTSTEPTEVWRELCHRYLVYPAEVDGRPADVVFAVPVAGRRAAVRAGVAWDVGSQRQDDDSGPQRVHSPV